MTTLLRRALCMCLPLLAACSDGPPSATPTAPSTVAPPAGNNTTSVVSITGSVFDTAVRPLPGAKVEVLDGVSAGVSANADASGVVVLSGRFDSSTRFRASMAGHETLTTTWTCSVPNCANNARPWFGFQLRPLAVPIDLAGDYVMTITANASCATLPQDARSRSYPASLTRRFREGTADLVGFDGVLQVNEVSQSMRQFRVGVAGDFLSMYFRRGDGDEPGLVEQLAGDRYVAFTGNAAGTANANGPSHVIAFSGAVDNLVLRRAPSEPFLFSDVISKDSCTSSDHRLTLTRRP